MRRAEYEAARQTQHPVHTRFKGLARAIETELRDLGIEIDLYDEGMYMFRICRGNNVLIDGLNPAYANGGDYRRIILALEDKWTPKPRN